MKGALVLVLLAAAVSHAQPGAIERGAQLYRTQCATPYCHGPEGVAGRAPRLIGHHYNVNQMFKVITWGIAGTGMPEFTTRLKTGEIADLVAYAMTLGGSAPASAPAPVTPPRALTPEAGQGRALFFDAARTGACGSCHELDGWGVPVGPDLTALPPGHFTDLRGAAPGREVTGAPHGEVTREVTGAPPGVVIRELTGVVTARPRGGEPPFPALLVERTEARVRVYDLTAGLPVLRTFAAGQIVLQAGSSWRHEQAARIYTGGELETIAVFLRWHAGQ